MSRVINFDKGSKRRLRLIRWKQEEIISAIVLFLILGAICVWFALREASHYRLADPPMTPQVKEAGLGCDSPPGESWLPSATQRESLLGAGAAAHAHRI